MWRLGLIYLCVAIAAGLLTLVLSGRNAEFLSASTAGLFLILAIVAFVASALPADLGRPRRTW